MHDVYSWQVIDCQMCNEVVVTPVHDCPADPDDQTRTNPTQDFPHEGDAASRAMLLLSEHSLDAATTFALRWRSGYLARYLARSLEYDNRGVRVNWDRVHPNKAADEGFAPQAVGVLRAAVGIAAVEDSIRKMWYPAVDQLLKALEDLRFQAESWKVGVLPLVPVPLDEPFYSEEPLPPEEMD